MADFEKIPRLSVREAVILELLITRREMYGLEIVRASDRRVKQGMLYVTLNRMLHLGAQAPLSTVKVWYA